MIKAENYIVVQGWMVTELKLKGNDLLVYALIYGFSQAEGQAFTGGLQYIADWTNSTKQGVIKNLKSLLEKNLIAKTEKFINGIKFCEYRTTKFNGVLNKVEQGIKQSLTEGMQQSLPNNLFNNTRENSNNKDSAPLPEPVKELPEQAGVLASLLHDLHRAVDPKYEKNTGHIKSWASDIEKINRIDGRDWKDIEAVIRWAKTPGGFWFPNIMSGKKLREKFPMLWVQMARPTGGVQKHRIAADATSGGDW